MGNKEIPQRGSLYLATLGNLKSSSKRKNGGGPDRISSVTNLQKQEGNKVTSDRFSSIKKLKLNSNRR